MLPEFFDGRNLPEGLHEAGWGEFEERFGSSSEKRISLCRQLRDLLQRAKDCSFRGVVVFGSFVSAKLEPGDFDLLWLLARDIDRSLLSESCRELLDSSTSRDRFGCDVFDGEDGSEFVTKSFPSPTMGFGWDKETKTPRGLVILRMEGI